MSSVDRIEPLFAKIERAEEHVRDLESEVGHFFRSVPYSIVQHTDLDTGEQTREFRILKEPPLRVSVIVGDIAHNLRSALDNLAWQLVLANGGTPTRDTGFPISGSAKEFETKGLGKIRGASAEATELIRACKPYKGGNDALFALHRLSVLDKHRLLVTVAVAYRDILDTTTCNIAPVEDPDIPDRNTMVFCPGSKGGMSPDGGTHRLGTQAHIFFRSKDPKEFDRWFARHFLRRSRPDPSDPKYYPDVIIDVAFGQGEVFEGQPVVPTFHRLVDLVKGLLEPFRPLLS